MNPGMHRPLWLLGAFSLLAVVGPALAGSDPLAIQDVIATRLVPPFSRDAHGAWHLLGTDRFGRDLAVRTLLAARISIFVGIAGSLLAALLGVAIGAIAAWAGGVIDRMLMGAGDALLSLPRLVLLLVCAALWTPGLATVILVLCLTGWMSVARLVRAEVLLVQRLPWVDALRAVGVPPRRILWRHVVPNATGPAIVAATLGVGNAILLESGLAFLGLGVQPPTPSWGNMIAGGRDLIVTAPWIALAPGLALIFTVLLCAQIGDAVAARRGISTNPQAA